MLPRSVDVLRATDESPALAWELPNVYGVLMIPRERGCGYGSVRRAPRRVESRRGAGRLHRAGLRLAVQHRSPGCADRSPRPWLRRLCHRVFGLPPWSPSARVAPALLAGMPSRSGSRLGRPHSRRTRAASGCSALFSPRPGLGLSTAAAFPFTPQGRRPRALFRGLLGVHVCYAEPPWRPFGIESFSRFVACSSVPTAAGRNNQLPGRDFHPLKNSAFARRTVRDRIGGRFPGWHGWQPPNRRLQSLQPHGGASRDVGCGRASGPSGVLPRPESSSSAGGINRGPRCGSWTASNVPVNR